MLKISRLGRLAGAVASVALGLSATQAMAAQNCLDLPPNKVGLQLYTFLADLRPPASPAGPAAGPIDPAQLNSVLGALQGAGWRNVENFGSA